MVLSDEEVGGEFGTKFMVEEHQEVFEGVKYALGEFGGASVWIAGKKFYPIQVAERQICTLELVVKGTGGHGASGVADNAMEKLAKVLKRLTVKRMPVHITEPVRMMVASMADHMSGVQKWGLKGLLNPSLTDAILDRLGTTGTAFVPMFHNTANPTIVQGGNKRNVIPSEIRLILDGRMLPGFQPEDFIVELRALIGFGEEDVEINILGHEPGPAEIDMGLFEHLAMVLREMDPEGAPIPLVLPQVTDGRHLAKLGIQSYGFTPMILPKGFEFFNLAHAPDERIPVEAVRFGAEGIYRALKGYIGSG
jgi:acetylornithine deacetylase/succinyl-diaminopimelate desuccinylase-like protein